MLEVVLTEEFRRRYQDLPQHIQKKAEKQEKLFSQNSFHPSLHTEKLEPKSKEVWSFRIDRQYRIFFRFINGNKVLYLTVGPQSDLSRGMTKKNSVFSPVVQSFID